MENVQIIAYRFNGNPDELIHYRTKGSVNGRRLYQYPDGSLTPLGRIHYGIKTKRTEKKRAENLAKAREAKKAKKIAAEEEAKKKAEQEAAEAKEREAKEAEKQRIIKSGTAAEALSIVGDLDPVERKYISDRIKWEDEMKKATPEDVDKGKKRVENFFNHVDNATKYAESTIKVYNTAANVINAFNGEKVMPRIDTNIKDGNKKDVKDRKNQIKQQKEAAAKRAKQEAEGDAKRAERAKKKDAQNQSNDTSQQQNTDNDEKINKTAGMKWNARRYQNEDGSLTDRGKKTYEKYKAKAEKKAAKEQAKQDRKNDNPPEAEIIGEGKSKSNIKNESNNTKKDKPADYYDPIEYYDEPISNIPSWYQSAPRDIERYWEDRLPY